MKKIYTIEDFQDSTIYINNQPSKFIIRSLIILFLICLSIIILLFFIKKSDYIKADAVLSPKNEPINVVADKDVKISKINKTNNQLIQSGEKVINFRDINNKHQIETKIQYKEEKLEDLSNLYKKINDYPLETSIDLKNKYSINQFEEYKKLYNEYSALFNNPQISMIQSEFKQNLNEKIDILKDEITDLKSSDTMNKDFDSSPQKGYILFSNKVQEGMIIPKGDLLYQIYPSKEKEIITYISNDDILNLKESQKVSIKFKNTNEELTIKGTVQEISKFPEISNDKQSMPTYKVKISIPQKLPNKFQNVFHLKGVAYIELEKETIAKYLYGKLKS